MASIYGLYDSAGQLRYIGKANAPEVRLRGHMRDAKRRKTPLYSWINKHGQPTLRVLESDCQDWRASEKRLIAEARERGERLLNLAAGGDEPHCPTEVRAENGMRSVTAFRTGTKFDGSHYTNDEVVIDAYKFATDYYARTDQPAKLIAVIERMRESHSDRPDVIEASNEIARRWFR